MSKKLFVFSLFFVTFCTSNAGDFTKFDYCKINVPIDCKEGAETNEKGHPACHCKTVAPRQEVGADNTKAINAFRQKILHVHNDIRNKIASGKETKVPKASNMMVLNYDMEMEYIARCRALNSFDGHHESCTYDSNKQAYGQNLFGSTAYQDDVEKVPQFMETWYAEIKDVDANIINQYPKESPAMIGHFTQLVWAETTHVGCVRVWNKDLPEAAYRFAMICNYKPAGNVIEQPVYKTGEGCSACPDGTKCETKKYPALCGKFQEVTEEGSKGEGGSGSGSGDGETTKEQNKTKKANSQICCHYSILIIASSFFVVFIF